jgi:hypothetical protein
MKQTHLLIRYTQRSTTTATYTHPIIAHLRPAQDTLVSALNETLKNDILKKRDDFPADNPPDERA